MKKNYVQPDCRSIRCLEETAILAGSPGDKYIGKKDPKHETNGDSRYLVGIGIYFGKPKKKETFIYNSS